MPEPGYVTIYGLVDPRTAEVRYVGRSIRPQVRHRSHIRKALKYGKTAKERWIQELDGEGLQPRLFSLEVVPAEQQLRAERVWAECFDNLLNEGTCSQGATPGKPYKLAWPKELEGRLGKVPDSLIAREFGFDARQVCEIRRQLGVRASGDRSACRPPLNWRNQPSPLPDWAIPLLGKMSDAQLGALVGFGKGKIAADRRRRGIPSCAATTGRTGKFDNVFRSSAGRPLGSKNRRKEVIPSRSQPLPK